MKHIDSDQFKVTKPIKLKDVKTSIDLDASNK